MRRRVSEQCVSLYSTALSIILQDRNARIQLKDHVVTLTHMHTHELTVLMYQLITVCRLTVLIHVSSLDHGNYINYMCMCGWLFGKYRSTL